jgi:hypothetical protein
MAYTYLIDLQGYIDGRAGEARDALAKLDGDSHSDGASFQEGRLEALTAFKAFLTENLNPKLPRAIRRQL